MAFLAALYALVGSSESLWLDELHSSWTISGSFGQIVDRAAEGNQSPVYFWLLWLSQSIWGRTLGTEFALRLPSILAWAAAVWLITRHLLGRSAEPESRVKVIVSVAIVAAWILLDRIQLFYATEARVYSLVQLLSLVGWLLCMRLIDLPDASVPEPLRFLERGHWNVVAWSVSSILLIYLHLTAGLAVSAQWFFLSAWAVRSSTRRFATMLVAGVVVGIVSFPAVQMAKPVWERREQWTSFAGDASIDNLVHLFPLLELLLPVLLALVIQRLWFRRVFQVPTSDSRIPRDRQWIMWLVAAAAPWGLAWVVTILDVAPVFHRRFVIASALPLVLLAASLWNRVYVPWLKYLCGACVILALVIGQGSVAIWMQGDITGWQRAEGWREASRWAERRIAPGETLWVASGLIEGRDAQLPLSAEFGRYLSYPLRGGYRVRDRLGAVVEPNALLNDSRLWEQQWRTRVHDDEKLWIIFRGPADRLDSILKNAQTDAEQPFAVVVEPQGFGRVAVAAVTLNAD